LVGADATGNQTGTVELTILMPCLNEAQTLATCIRKARAFVDAGGVNAEILVADNGSTDGSQRIACELGARVVPVAARGYGSAIHHGILAAHGRFIIMGDADDSYDFGEVGPMLARLRDGADLVMGNRRRGGIRSGAMPWKNRYLGNPILTAIGRLLLRCPAGDFHCGLRGFSAEAFRRMDLRTTGMEFASEMVIKATLLKMRIEEVPVTLSPDGRNRPPHLRPWRDGWRHLRFMMLFSPRWLLLYPGLLLTLTGLCGVGRLMLGPVHLGPVTLSVHTMVYFAAMVMIGFQVTLFSLFARIFAFEEGLLPEDQGLKRLHSLFTLEKGLIFGSLVLLAGLALAIGSVADWAGQSFGNLDPEHVMRLVIPATMLVTVGVQTIFSSFFFSILGLRLRFRR
jgi:glycosyltransferase involved in cell wall biosynthesis